MAWLPIAAGRLEYRAVGAGEPVTVFAHGLGGSIAQTRLFGSGVPGTRVFFHFRGHGASMVRGERSWGYAELAGELAAVADHVSARQALGVSLGAGALLRLIADSPRRFERVVFVLPSVIDSIRGDGARKRLGDMAAAARTGSVRAMSAVVAADVPPQLSERPDVKAYVEARARALLTVRDGIAAVAGEVAVPDRAVLHSIDCQVLVVGCEGDQLHDVAVARELAALLPDARLHVFPEPGFVWSRRGELRELVSGFLTS